MKIKRFVARDMRSALEQIKLELGPDAVIMSNKKIPEGVELMAAIDNQKSETPLQNQAQQPSDDLAQDKVTLQSSQRIEPSFHQQKVEPNSISKTIQDNMRTETAAPADSLSALLNRQVQYSESASVESGGISQNNVQELPLEQQFKNFTDRLESSQNIQQHSEQTAEHPQSVLENFANVNDATGFEQPQINNQVTESAEIEHMRNEMASIRELLEHQVAGLLWQDMAQKHPNRAMIIERLQNMGISKQLSEQLAGYASANVNDKAAWQQVIDVLTQQLNTTNNDIIRHGGVVSLVGPTGVGKTTTIAKLAARFAQTHGADSVALISTDTYRIAGFEQLTTYARIIGCQVKLAKDHNELDDLIQSFSGKKLVLIDTAGMGQRDMRLSQYLTSLISNARVRIRNYLVLSANTQARVMQENVERFKKIPLSGAIFTKLDESLSFGELISTSIENALPIGYLTDGQRVPEDIKVANAEKLVTLADKMATKYVKEHSTLSNPVVMSGNACA